MVYPGPKRSGLTINRLESGAKMAKGIKAKERLWLTADRSRAVKDGDPEAAFLLAAPGQTIPQAEAERLGLVPKKKAVAGPPEDKAAKPGGKKQKG